MLGVREERGGGRRGKEEERRVGRSMLAVLESVRTGYVGEVLEKRGTESECFVHEIKDVKEGHNTVPSSPHLWGSLFLFMDLLWAYWSGGA